MTYEPEWNPKRPHVPVDEKGNWLGYPTHWQTKEWITILVPFYAELKVAGMETGRSSKKVILTDDHGKRYPMFVADLVDGIQQGNLEVWNGRLKARWTAAKRGANYGIKAVK